MRIQIATLSPLFFAALLSTAACSGGDDDDDQQAAGPDAWVGHTYLLDITPTRWVEPPGIGAEMGRFVPQFALQVEAEADGNLDLLIGAAHGGAQEPCNPTTTATATSTYPGVQIGPVDFPIYLTNPDPDSQSVVNATVYDLTITDVLPDRDTLAEAGVMLATLDARQVYPLFTAFGSNPTADAVCRALPDWDAACTACPSDGQEFCLTLRAVRLGATEGNPIDPIDAANVPASCAAL